MHRFCVANFIAFSAGIVSGVGTETERLVLDPPRDCRDRFLGNIESARIGWLVNEGTFPSWNTSMRAVFTELIQLLPEIDFVFYNWKGSNLDCLMKDVSPKECELIRYLGSGISALTTVDEKYRTLTKDESEEQQGRGLHETILYLQSLPGHHVNFFFPFISQVGADGTIAEGDYSPVPRYTKRLEDTNVGIVLPVLDPENDHARLLRSEVRSFFSDKRLAIGRDDMLHRNPKTIAEDLAARAMRYYCYYPKVESIPQRQKNCLSSRLKSKPRKVEIRVAVSNNKWTSWALNTLELKSVLRNVVKRLEESYESVVSNYYDYDDNLLCVKDSNKRIYNSRHDLEDLEAHSVEAEQRVVDTSVTVGENTAGLDVLYALNAMERPQDEEAHVVNILVAQGQIQPTGDLSDISKAGTEGACGSVYGHPEAVEQFAKKVDRSKVFNFVLLGIDNLNYRNVTDWQYKLNGNLGDFGATVVDLDLGPIAASDVTEGLTNEVFNQICNQLDQEEYVPSKPSPSATCDYDPEKADVTVWFQADANIGRLAKGHLKDVVDSFHERVKGNISYGIFQGVRKGECLVKNNQTIVVMKSNDPNDVLEELDRIPFVTATSDMRSTSFALNLLATKEKPERPSVNIVFAAGNPITDSRDNVSSDLSTATDIHQIGWCYGIQNHLHGGEIVRKNLGNNTKNYVFVVPEFNGYLNKNNWKESVQRVFADTTEIIDGDFTEMTPTDLADTVQSTIVDGLCKVNIYTTTSTTTTTTTPTTTTSTTTTTTTPTTTTSTTTSTTTTTTTPTTTATTTSTTTSTTATTTSTTPTTTATTPTATTLTTQTSPTTPTTLTTPATTTSTTDPTTDTVTTAEPTATSTVEPTPTIPTELTDKISVLGSTASQSNETGKTTPKFGTESSVKRPSGVRGKNTAQPIIIGCGVGAAILAASAAGGWMLTRSNNGQIAQTIQGDDDDDDDHNNV